MTLTRVANLVWDLYAPASFWARALALGRAFICPFDRILEHVPRRGRLVELGCGTGVFSNLVAVSRPQQDVLGIDANPNVIEAAMATVGARTNIAFQVARVEEYDLPEPVDVVAAIDLFHHLAKPTQVQTALRAYHRLKPGGVFLLKEIDRQPRWMSLANRLHDSIMDPGNPQCVRDREEWRRLLVDMGFVVEVTVMHRLVYPHVLLVCRKAQG